MMRTQSCIRRRPVVWLVAIMAAGMLLTGSAASAAPAHPVRPRAIVFFNSPCTTCRADATRIRA